MRILFCIVFVALLSNCGERKVIAPPLVSSPKAEQATVVPERASEDFQPVREMLGRSCAPCHNPGGKMYATLPFDNPDIVSSHAPSILRRLKTPEDQQLLESWLAEKTR
jgi:hypothetical protein